jgi:hypothetical protein
MRNLSLRPMCRLAQIRDPFIEYIATERITNAGDRNQKHNFLLYEDLVNFFFEKEPVRGGPGAASLASACSPG